MRHVFSRVLDQGWTDALRLHPPQEIFFTFWDYFRNAYARNAGLRIDHLRGSPSLIDRLRAFRVDHEVRGWDRSSDHLDRDCTLKQPANGPDQTDRLFSTR